jgi:signal transduction histidine kinase/FixJ family two-component response regulator
VALSRVRSAASARLFAVSLAGMALATFTAVMLALKGMQGEDVALRLLLLAATILIFAYGLAAALSAWRVLRDHARELSRALRELEEARSRAEEAAEAKSRLLAVITHELRTPMNGVIGMAGLLRETPLTPEQENYVRTIEASGRSLLSIIDELLDTARAETGELSITERAFPLAGIVEDVCELMSPRAHAKDIDLACFVDPALPETVVGDAARLRQVLFNLIGNAIRYTDRGGVFVRVLPALSASPSPEEIRVRFEVRDTGIGIDERDRSRIFRAWEQGRNADGRGGTGLGLAISRRLIERMKGHLDLESTPGKGTTFHFEVPLRVATSAAAPAADMSEETAEAGLRGREVHLFMPPSPRRAALAAYVEAFGGRAVMALERDTPAEELPAFPADAIAICDALHATALRRALREQRADLARVWLLLRPEQRRELSDLMRAGRLAGWLLTPLRRSTFRHHLLDGAERPRSATAAAGDASRQNVAVPAAASAGAAEMAGIAPATSAIAAAGTTSVASTAPAADGTGAASGTPSHEKARRALLVEDNAINAALAIALLERAGWQVVHHREGAAALEWLRQRLRGKAGERPAEWPDIIIMDVHMPGMNGLEVTAALRRMEAAHGLPRTPVLALTAGNAAEERERCLAAGMDAFLAKPFDRADLEETLAHLYQGRTRPAA